MGLQSSQASPGLGEATWCPQTFPCAPATHRYLSPQPHHSSGTQREGKLLLSAPTSISCGHMKSPESSTSRPNQ